MEMGFGRFVSAERAPDTHRLGSLTGLGATLDTAVAKKKIPAPSRNGTPVL
jgi:hypothetical protein